MLHLKPILAAAALLFAAALASAQEKPAGNTPAAAFYRLDPQTSAGLQAVFLRSEKPLPLVSAHRGGPQKGFPENCIATFENTLRHAYAMLECDPRYTKDHEIVILHDPTLERTTTGRGKAIDFTLAELKALRLKDPEGNPTDFQIPTLAEVLDWARGKTVVVLDQKDVPVAARVKAIEEHKAEGCALMIVNTFADAQACYAANPHIVMEVMIASREKLAEFEKLHIPWRNVVAFVGHTPPDDLKLYEQLHAHGVCCMIGTSRNLDRKFLAHDVTEISALEPDYRAFLAHGADLIETDIPTALGPLLYRATPVPAAQQAYFHPPAVASRN